MLIGFHRSMHTRNETNKMIEDGYLVFKLKCHFIEAKESWVLLFKFLPHK